MALPDALIVPVNLQACACGTLQPAPARVDYSQLPPTGNSPGNNPPIAAFTDASQLPGPAAVSGVQLHWALPGALVAQGDWTEFMAPANATNPPKVSLLPAPDQWLVVRTIIDDKQQISYATWVVDSGVLNGTASPGGPPMATMPTNLPQLQGNNTASYQTLGQTSSGPAWTAPAPANCLTPVTAAGRGQASFAGYLPDCINVFGMCDPVPTDQTGTASYLVVGWYRDPTTDPLAVRQRTAKEVRENLNWKVEHALPDDLMPQQTIFTGFVSSVQFNAPAAQPALGVEMAFGVNPASALSALLAAEQEANVSGFGRALTALIYGRLDLAEQADATTLIDNLLHRVGFSAIQPPHLSAVDLKSTKPGGAANPNLPLAISQAMLAANAAELAAHRLNRLSPPLTNQLFWDWQNYVTQLYDGASEGTLSPVMAALTTGTWSQNSPSLSSTQVLGNVAQAFTTQQATATSLQTALAQSCADAISVEGVAAKSAVEYQVAARAIPPFHAPLDPGFAVSGTSLEGPNRIADSTPGGAAPALMVRLSSGIIGSLTIDENTAGASQKCVISGSDIAFGSLPPALPNLAVAQALYAESCLIDPYYATQLASAVPAAGVSASQLAALLQSLLTGYTVPSGLVLADQAGTTASSPPRPGLTYWAQNPWLPVFLRWKATFTPLATGTLPLPATTVTGNFSLASADTDLIPNAGTPTSPQDLLIEGLGALSTSVSDRMAKILKDATSDEVIDTVTVDNLHAIGQALATTPIHTGHLEGFYHQVLQLARQPQLPPVDLMNVTGAAGANATLLSFTQAIAAAAPGDTMLGLPANTIPPLTPFVSGGVTVTLTLVDCFGQTFQLQSTGATTTDDVLTPPSTYSLDGQQFYLPPRVACASRLLARWVAPIAGTATLDHPTQPAVNPIRGWLLPVPANQALLIYDAEGRPLVEMTGGADGPSYMPTPRSPVATAGTGSQALASALQQAGADSVLISFVLQLANLNGSLPAFIETLDVMATDSSPNGALLNPAVSALIGRLLAVVQAATSFEFDGPPPADQSPAGFQNYQQQMQSLTNQPGAIPVRDSAGLLQLQFPLLVGDDGQDNDGLYAYSANDTGPVYVATSASVPAGCMAASPAPISLAAANADQPTLLTMLIDPTAPVHLAMGILPVSTLSVPSAFYQDALANLTATISTGPLLTGLPLTTSLATVVPGVGQGDWTWVQRQIAEPTISAEQTPLWSTPLPLKPLDTSSQVPNGTPGLVEGWLSLNVSAVEKKGPQS